MNQLEQKVSDLMRAALAHLDTDHWIVREKRNEAHRLFGDHLLEWSEDFCVLYSQMLDIYRAHTPMPRGHYRVKHVGIGYSSFPIHLWVEEKEQPLIPTADELVARFDRAIRLFLNGKQAAGRSSSPYFVPQLAQM